MPGNNSLFALLWVLVCVVLIIGLAYFFTRHVVGRTYSGAMGSAVKTGKIKVLARLALGRDSQLFMVQVGNRYFLLGSGGNAVSNLAEFTPEEAEAWLAAENQPGGEQPPSFLQAMQSVLKQKTKR